MYFRPVESVSSIDVEELRAFYRRFYCASNIVVGFIRIEGQSVGVIANQPMVPAGCLDVDASKTGTDFEGVPVFPISKLAELAKEQNIRLAILAVPAAAANEVAEQVAEAGIQGILNFAPVTLNPVESVSSVGVDLAIELEQLCYSVVKSQAKK